MYGILRVKNQRGLNVATRRVIKACGDIDTKMQAPHQQLPNEKREERDQLKIEKELERLRDWSQLKMETESDRPWEFGEAEAAQKNIQMEETMKQIYKDIFALTAPKVVNTADEHMLNTAEAPHMNTGEAFDPNEFIYASSFNVLRISTGSGSFPGFMY